MNNKEDYYKNIALDLFDKYIDDEMNLIYEYSFNFKESKEILFKKAEKYLKKLNALNLLGDYKKKICGDEY